MTELLVADHEKLRVTHLMDLRDRLNANLRDRGFSRERCEWYVVRIESRYTYKDGTPAGVCRASVIGIDGTTFHGYIGVIDVACDIGGVEDHAVKNVGDLSLACWDDNSAWTLLYSEQAARRELECLSL